MQLSKNIEEKRKRYTDYPINITKKQVVPIKEQHLTSSISNISTEPAQQYIPKSTTQKKLQKPGTLVDYFRIEIEQKIRQGQNGGQNYKKADQTARAKSSSVLSRRPSPRHILFNMPKRQNPSMNRSSQSTLRNGRVAKSFNQLKSHTHLTSTQKLLPTDNYQDFIDRNPALKGLILSQKREQLKTAETNRYLQTKGRPTPARQSPPVVSSSSVLNQSILSMSNK